MKDLYNEFKSKGLETDSYESDLYVKNTPEALEIVKQYIADGGNARPVYFNSQIDNKQWIELPFMFTPWWDKKAQ